MKPEDKARCEIDAMLQASGWAIQDYEDLDLSASLGIAVREFPLGKKAVDYALFIRRNPVGVVEAKKNRTDVIRRGRAIRDVPARPA